MILSLDMGSDIPIYVQLRNQIVTGIGMGGVKSGKPTPDCSAACTGCGGKCDDCQ